MKGFVGHSELSELINSIVHVGHIKLFKLSRLIVDSSSEGAQISKLIVDYILIPSSEGARRAALKLIVKPQLFSNWQEYARLALSFATNLTN